MRAAEPRKGWLFVAPALLVYAAFVLAPLAHGAWLSLFEWDGVSVGTWVGLDNYRAALSGPELREAFGHSLVLILFFSVIPIVVALALTGAIARMPVRGLTAYRVILFVPQVLSTVVVATTWRWIYADDGPLNELLRALGLGGVARPWLGDYDWALIALGLVGTWTMTGLCLVLFLAAVQRIPRDLYDAARADGAGLLQELRAVTLPGIRPQIGVVAVITTIAALKSFDLVYVLTRGGPGSETTVPSLLIWRQAFREYQVGSAAAVGILVALAIGLVVLALRRVSGRWEIQ
jgi:raffinose/stachyose/melibiose transport system permease protein